MNKLRCQLLVSYRGSKRYFYDGKLHRVGAPAIEYYDGHTLWLHHGEVHREGGPASETPNGYKEYYIHNKRHREDGPAVIYSDETQSYYLNNVMYPSRERWQSALEKLKLARIQTNNPGLLDPYGSKI